MYPAGSKQGRVRLPAIILLVDAELLVQSTEAEQQISQALAAGVTAVLLTGGTAAGALENQIVQTGVFVVITQL